jgi:4-amino-4-deoxy-L-arabinose transferase-like glycosyltransferase
MGPASDALVRPVSGERSKAASAARALLVPHHLALLAILALSALLGLWRLDGEGTANAYYAAAVRSMVQNPAAFFFGAFDAGGFISLDKPPAGFWVQALFVAILGFSGVALLLPQVLATVGSVGLVYALVRRPWGVRAGLLAAVAMAVTPVTVATGRNNTPDMTLVFVLLVGAWALMRGIDTGRLRWLVVAMVLVGVGFNVKMLEAYLALPAFGVAWLAGAPGSVRRRVGQLIIATISLLAVSFSWAVIVELVPAAARPYVGGSQTNSALELAFGYNGIDRLTAGMPFGDTGTPGPLRFLEPVLAGQVGWLLAFAVTGGLAALPALRSGGGARARRRRGSLVLWGTWLATTIVFFSVARFWHRHYLVVVAPAVAALAGLGTLLLWRAVRRRSPAAWLLPCAILGAALLAHSTIAATTEMTWLADPVLIVGLLAALALALVLTATWWGGVDRVTARAAGAVLLGLALVGALLPPAAWSAWTAANPSGSSLPTGGPAVTSVAAGPGGRGLGAIPGGMPGPGGLAAGADGGPATSGGLAGGATGGAAGGANSPLLAYLVANRGSSTWIIAVASSQEAAPLIVTTGLPVMALGGFSGGDPAITVAGFRGLVRRGQVRFVAGGGVGDRGFGGGVTGFGGGPGGPGGSGAVGGVLAWAQRACSPVRGYANLYDCAAAGA